MPDIVEAINCPQCGAPLPMATGEVIVTCPYCGTASRLNEDRPFILKHAMLPSRLDDARARDAIRSWMVGGFMKPDDLARASRLVALGCTYLPFYVFQVDAATDYSGVLTRIGTNEQRKGQLVRSYTWKVLGRRDAGFPVRDYKLPLAQKVPFDAATMVPGSKFLNAEMDEDEATTEARGQVEAHQGELLKDLVDVVEVATTRVQVKDAEFLHAPLWFATYDYKGRSFDLILDGASGEVVHGDIPPPVGGFGEFLRGGLHGGRWP